MHHLLTQGVTCIRAHRTQRVNSVVFRKVHRLVSTSSTRYSQSVPHMQVADFDRVPKYPVSHCTSPSLTFLEPQLGRRPPRVIGYQWTLSIRYVWNNPDMLVTSIGYASFSAKHIRFVPGKPCFPQVRSTALRTASHVRAQHWIRAIAVVILNQQYAKRIAHQHENMFGSSIWNWGSKRP